MLKQAEDLVETSRAASETFLSGGLNHVVLDPCARHR